MSFVASAARDLASEYVASVIEKCAVRGGPESATVRAAEELVPVVREWAGRYLLGMGLSGSYAKGTATTLGTDVDVFISLRREDDMEAASHVSKAGKLGAPTMKDIYWGLFQFLAERGLRPQAGNVSMRVERNGVKVDLVPGRRQGSHPSGIDLSQVSKSAKPGAPAIRASCAALKGRSSTVAPTFAWLSNNIPRFEKRETWGTPVPSHKPIPGICSGDHTLYRRKKDSWMQTNVAEHIRLVAGSGRTQEIRAIKIWRERNRLDFPSFYLELTVIDALKGGRASGLAANVWRALQYLADGFGKARVVDPANSNNVVSDDLRVEEKRVIAMAARKALSTSSWEQILW